jgi:hypothetical protein
MRTGQPFDTVIGAISYDAEGYRTTDDYIWVNWGSNGRGQLEIIYGSGVPVCEKGEEFCHGHCEKSC